MFDPVEVKPGVFWVGAVDWNLRDFHGYKTYRGSTYNAYLIIDEKVTLIDTVKSNFSGELLQRISKIIDPSMIDVIVSNHVEMDHSGSLPVLMSLAPSALIVTSDPHGLNGLRAHYGDAYNYLAVKPGDKLSIGERTLEFVKTTMVHWPDNMVTYCPEEKILFSNDAFGQHYASSKRFDDEDNLADIVDQAKKYYANIVMPYGKNAAKALEACAGLDIDIIAPGHGSIWRSHIDTILDLYRQWTSGEQQDYALVVYDTMWGTTDKMAKAIGSAFNGAGYRVRLFNLKEDHPSDIIPEVLDAKFIAVGTPTLNNTMLPSVAAFLCYLKGLTTKDKKAFAFGSYGWAPKGQNEVNDILAGMGYDIVMEPVTHNWPMDVDAIADLREEIRNRLV
ncbi:MAG: FprA family A-type flavoprotein [Coriobacteriales bacterium]|jgi:flavorubredoxin